MLRFEKKHVGEQVLMFLRKQILLGELKEGDHLKELELSKSLNVSRGPIREAISQLEKEGLVTTRSNGRTLVNKFDKKDIENLYDTRILLEKHAVTQITPEKLAKNLPKLNALVEQLESEYKKGIKDVESDLEFHATIVKMTENKTLIQLWLSLYGLIQTLIEVTSSFEKLRQENIISEHKSILDSLVEGDVERTQQFIEQHIRGVQLMVSKEL